MTTTSIGLVAADQRQTETGREFLRATVLAASLAAAALLLFGAWQLVTDEVETTDLFLDGVARHELVAGSSGAVGENGIEFDGIPADVASRLDAHVRTWRGPSSVVVEMLYKAPDAETAEEVAQLMESSWVQASDTRIGVPGLPGASGLQRVQGESTLDAVVYTDGAYGVGISVLSGGAGGPSVSELAHEQADLLE